MGRSVLVSGANGRTGRAVTTALRTHHAQPKVFVRNAAQWPELRERGASMYAVGDMQDAASIRAAMVGCDTVVHIGPPMHPAEVEITQNFLEAARTANVEKFVYYSVMHPLRREVRHHRLKLDAEESVIESGLRYVIVQPSRYMQHLQSIWAEVLSAGLHAMPFNTHVAFNVVHLADLAEATAIVTMSADFDFGTFELAGPDALSQNDMARIISMVTGKPVRAQSADMAAVAAKARAAGVNEDRISQMTIMNEHYNRYGFRGNSQVLRAILGRAPTDFRAYVKSLCAA